MLKIQNLRRAVLLTKQTLSANSTLMGNNKILTIPSFNYSLNHKMMFRFTSEDESGNESKPAAEVTAENAQMIIERWVKGNKVVLFMKGTPANPQCGYSNFVVELLKKYGKSKLTQVLTNIRQSTS